MQRWKYYKKGSRNMISSEEPARGREYKGRFKMGNKTARRGVLAGTVLYILIFALTATAREAAIPTRENPLIVDKQGNRLLIYTEVNEMNLHQANSHWGVVFKDGRFEDRAILRSWAKPTAFHDGLLALGAKPGNNLNKETIGKHLEGDLLDVTATWPGQEKEVGLNEIISESGGKGFAIRFGGNRTASAEQNSGCITCLESCWVAISSNSAYPQSRAIKRFFNPNATFQGKGSLLPKDGKPVILIYRIHS
jgi:hypothetical protein